MWRYYFIFSGIRHCQFLVDVCRPSVLTFHNSICLLSLSYMLPISCAHLGTGIVTFIWHNILAHYREQSSPWSSWHARKHTVQAEDARNVGHIYPKERTHVTLWILWYMDQQGHQRMHILGKTGPYKACAIPPKGERPASWSCEPVQRRGADGGKSHPINGILTESGIRLYAQSILHCRNDCTVLLNAKSLAFIHRERENPHHSWVGWERTKKWYTF